jgi:hypothetical protein
MRITTGRVVGGKIGKIVVEDAPFREGQAVTVIAAEGGEAFELDQAGEAALLAVLRSIDADDTIDGEDLLDTLPPRD